MATKRMISNTVIRTDDFSRMSQGAQLLYFYLNMSADDDGFNAAPVNEMMLAKASQEDLNQLVNHKYIIPFQNGVIVVRHWLINNELKEKTYHPTLYMKEKNLLGAGENGEYELIEFLPAGTKNLPRLQVEKGTTPLAAKDLRREYKRVQLEMDNLLEEEYVQLDIDNLPRGEEIREDKVRREEETPHSLNSDNLYGELRNVFLLPNEFKNIVNTYQMPFKLIDKISYYLSNAKKTYSSHYALIKKIALEDEWLKKPVKKVEEKIADNRLKEEIEEIMKTENVDKEEAERIYKLKCEEARMKVLNKLKGTVD